MVENITDVGLKLGDLLPSDLLSQLDKLIFISKIAIYLILAYIVFLLIKQFYGWRRNKRINEIHSRVIEIDAKLDTLIAGHKNIEYEPEKKMGFFSRFFGRKEKKGVIKDKHDNIKKKFKNSKKK